jgi:hypothetical protein
MNSRATQGDDSWPDELPRRVRSVVPREHVVTLRDGSVLLIVYEYEPASKLTYYGDISGPSITIKRPSGRLIEAWYEKNGVLRGGEEPAIRLVDPTGALIESRFGEDDAIRRTIYPDGRTTEEPMEPLTWRFWHSSLDMHGWSAGLDDGALIPDWLHGDPAYFEGSLVGK